MSNILRGIVATGASRKQAVSNYRLLARGKGVQAYAGAGNDVFLAVSSALDSFNPVTGNLDMVVAEGVLDHCDFTSNSATAEVHYTVCNSCQNHIIADDASLVSHCSACGDEVEFPEGEVSESEDEDDVDAAVDEADDEADDASEDGEEADAEEAEDTSEDEEEVDAGETEEEDEESEDDESESGDDHDFEDDEDEGDGEEPIDLTDDDPEVPVDDEIAEAAAAMDDVDLDDQLTVVASTYEQALSAFVEMSCEDGVSQSSQLQAHYQVCHNCDSHIISESSVHECPSCSGDVDEPDQEDAEVSFDDVDLDADEGDGEEPEDGEDDASESEDLAILDEDGDDEEDAGDEEVDAGEVDDAEDYEEDEASESAASEIEIDTLTDGIPVDASAADLDVSFSYVQKEPMWTLYHKGQPVATATASSVGDKADLFQREAFGQAFIQSVSAGVPAHKAAADFGFRGFDLTASVSAAVSRQAQDEIASVSSAAQAQIDAVQESLMQALSTAAMGINRGFFEGVASNPLRDGMIEALASAGVGNPQVLVDRVFAVSADAYHGLLFQQAVEILRHPREVQESLSSAVQRVNMVSASAASSVHSRVGQLGTPSAQAAQPQPAVQASESSDKSNGSVFAAAMSTFG